MMYYDYNNLLSRNALINFIIGERGVGKTYGAKKLCITDFIKNGHEFVYIRRYKTELSTSCVSFFKDLQGNGDFDDLSLTTKKAKEHYRFEMDGTTIGYGVALTTAAILKSTAFPNVKNVIFDEFLINQGLSYHYLKDEVTQFLELIETIGRLRDLRILMLGNATSITNPYFAYFGLSLPYNAEYKLFKDGLICVNYIRNYEYRKAKRESRFGKLIDGTDYGEYAIDNNFLYDDNNFIHKKTPESKFCATLIIDGVNFGIWSDYKSGVMFLSEHYDPKSPLLFACTLKEHNMSSKFIYYKKNPYVKSVIEHFSNGLLFFENQKVKNYCMRLINKCVAH